MKQVFLNIPDQDYPGIINHIQSHYKNIEIEEDFYIEFDKLKKLIVSEEELAKEWLTPEEDEAWRDYQ
jgi:hypothetical protein